MPPHALGSGTISFGLVSIPTKLYTTNESGSDISFNMLHEADGARLSIWAVAVAVSVAPSSSVTRSRTV